MDDDASSLGRKTLLILIQYLIGAILGYICIALSIRFIGPDIYGVISIGYGIFMLLIFFSDLGLKQAHMKFIAASRTSTSTSTSTSTPYSYPYDSKACNGAYLITKSILTFMVFISLILLYLSGYRPIHGSVLLIFVMCALFYNMRSIPEATFDGRTQTQRSQLPIISEHITRTLLTIMVAILCVHGAGTKAELLASTYAISLLFSMIFSYYFFMKHERFSMPTGKIVGRYLTFAPLIAFIGAIEIVLINIDKLILISYVSMSSLGVYFGLQRIAVGLLFISTGFITILLPVISDEIEEARRRFEFADRYYTMLLLPIFTLVIAFRELIIEIIMGSEYLYAADTFVSLCFGVLFLCLFRPNAILLSATGYNKITGKLSFLILFIYISLTIYFARFLEIGIDSAAYALIIVGILGFFGFRFYSSRYIKTKFISRDLSLQALSCFMIYILFTLVLNSITTITLKLIIAILIAICGIAIYTGSLIVLRSLNKEDIEFIKGVLFKIKRDGRTDKHNRNRKE